LRTGSQGAPFINRVLAVSRPFNALTADKNGPG
jgi:hypothetical protein